jgi:hypothetical protein
MRIRLCHYLLTAGILMLAAGSAHAFAPDPQVETLEFPLAFEANTPVLETQPLETLGMGRSGFLGSGWLAQLDRRTGYVHMAYGGDLSLPSGVADQEAAATAVRDFLLMNEDLLGTRPDNIELRNVAFHRGKYAVHYRQVVGGVPVYRSSSFAVLGENGRFMAFGSSFFPDHHEMPSSPGLSESDAIATAASALGAAPRTDRPIATDLYLVPAESGELMTLQSAYRVVFEAEEPLGKWESFVHASTGEILSRQNLYRMVNVTGNVSADVQFYGYCDGHSDLPMEHLQVNVSGGNSDLTDENGDYDIPHGGTSPVTVTAELRGPYFNVNRAAGLGPDANYSNTATPGTPHDIYWSGVNSRQDERDCFYNGNYIHDLLLAVDPTFTQLDYSMPTVVGRTDFYCPGNAWWDGVAINFCAAGGAYANTGEIGNVVYHEWGHGVTQELYGRNGAPEPPSGLHEGNSDVMSNFGERVSVIGYGFYQGNCSSGIRNSDNGMQYPAYDENGGHTAGQVIAGFHWDAWQSMLASMPQEEADAAALNAWHFGRDMGTPQTFVDQVLWTFIADDDDANLDNGTPNHVHFCLGATNHGFTCPEIVVGVNITHEKLPHTTEGLDGFDVAATIVSTEGAVDPTQLKVHYRMNGGPFFTRLMTATANPDEYSAHLPSILGNASEVEYYIYAKDMLGNERTHPTNAPADLHGFDVCQWYDDLESGIAGWTVGLPSDNATTGEWELIDPIGTAAQPDDDSTPAPGVLAFITGQCGGPNCSGGCTLGCNDVDGGTTTLVSPVYDLRNIAGARLKYDRWYSNNTGSDPNNDDWVVDVSNDGGTNWTNVENTTDSDARWVSHTIDLDALFGEAGQVQVRFIASDLGSGSLVEAGVDEIRVLGTFAPPDPTDAPSVDARVPISFALEQNQPNPFEPQTRIAYSVPEQSEVELVVFNVHGQTVRTLANGIREAGRYEVDWNGRDASGQRVSAGVYFYRLTAGERVLTKKMTVMK